MKMPDRRKDLRLREKLQAKGVSALSDYELLMAIISSGNAQAKTDQLIDRSITMLETMTGEADLSERIVTRHSFGPGDFAQQFNAWQYNAFGGESHLLRQSIFWRTPNKSRKLDNMYYVGAGTLPGIGLPMCLIGAELVYKRIIGLKAAGPLRAEDV